MPTLVLDVTVVVLIVKLALFAPAGTVMEAGIVIAETVPVQENVTTCPPVGAGPERATFPVTVLPPITGVGTLMELIVTVGGGSGDTTVGALTVLPL